MQEIQEIESFLQPTMKTNKYGALELSVPIEKWKQLIQKSEKEQQKPIFRSISSSEKVFSIPIEYSYSGSSLAKLRHKYFDTLLVGSHGFGTKNAQIGSTHILTSKNMSHVIHIGWAEYVRVGCSVTSLDFNLDGLQDIVISAPTTGLNNHQYWPKGEVRIFLAKKENDFEEQPNIVIFTNSKGTMSLGSKLIVGDFNDDGYDDLIIGSPFANISSQPQMGIVSVFLSKKSNSKYNQTWINVNQSDFSIHGEKLYNWFGHHVQITKLQGETVMFVSAPTFSVSNVQSIGRIYAFCIHKDNNSFAVTTKFTITGVSEFERCGFSFSVINNSLVFSCPTSSSYHFLHTREHAGSVILLNNLNEMKGDYSLPDLKFIVRIHGDQSFARFGYVVQWEDLNNDGVMDLIVTEPFRDTDWGLVDAGALYIWLGNSTLFQHSDQVIYTPSTSACKSVEWNEKSSRFGSAVVAGDFDKDGKTDLIVSAPHASEMNRFQGAVYFLHL